MRKELYKKLCEQLKTVSDGAIKHVDLWNHNVEFIEQEEQWERPAVFIEFEPIQWRAIVPGVEYRTEGVVSLHVVTDWMGSSAEGSAMQDESLAVFDLLKEIHRAVALLEGETFREFDLIGSRTNHNHDEIVESVESYGYVGIMSME